MALLAYIEHYSAFSEEVCCIFCVIYIYIYNLYLSIYQSIYLTIYLYEQETSVCMCVQ